MPQKKYAHGKSGNGESDKPSAASPNKWTNAAANNTPDDNRDAYDNLYPNGLNNRGDNTPNTPEKNMIIINEIFSDFKLTAMVDQ